VESKEYFDDVAHEWDGMRKSFFSEAVREKAFFVAGLQKGKLAADIGAGTGFITEGLIQRGVLVIAVDQSEAMLSEMKKKFSDLGEIDYRIGTAENLPIQDEIVDYAFANMFLHHVESPSCALKEMARIIKPDGRLVITDLDEHTFEFLLKEHHDRWMGFKREDIQGWFEEAGLRSVVVDCAGESCCGESCTGDDFASVSIFMASGEK
jgi:ubiquinone/menaquinone biosynthesis C-methylase UbiE